VLTRGTQVSKDRVFEFAQGLDFRIIDALHKEMLKAQDISPEVRRGFLLGALPESAEILYSQDPRFCVHSLPEKQTLMLMAALSKNPKLAKEYALSLLEGPRSTKVWNKAISILCEIEQLPPANENRKSLLERFNRLPKAAPQSPKPLPKPLPKKPVVRAPEIVHVVQAGDTLWHLSKRYGVDIDQIKKYNKLTTDALKPGSTLKIPAKVAKTK
jgi:hypothetical protein